MKSVLILIAIFFAVRALKNRLEDGKKPAPAPEPPRPRQEDSEARQSAEEMVLDPVCGHYVPISAAIALNKDGRTVYFCSGECRDSYDA